MNVHSWASAHAGWIFLAGHAQKSALSVDRLLSNVSDTEISFMLCLNPVCFQYLSDDYTNLSDDYRTICFQNNLTILGNPSVDFVKMSVDSRQNIKMACDRLIRFL